MSAQTDTQCVFKISSALYLFFAKERGKSFSHSKCLRWQIFARELRVEQANPRVIYILSSFPNIRPYNGSNAPRKS